MYQQALEIFKEYAVFCIYPVMAVILSWGLTRVCIHQLPRLGFVDLPDPTRRIHQHPIPRGGGIALIGAFFLTSIFYCTQQSPDNDPAWHFLFKFSLPALVILITGLLFALLCAPVSFCSSATRPPSTVLMLNQLSTDTGTMTALINSGGLLFGSASMFLCGLSLWPDSVTAMGGMACLAGLATLLGWRWVDGRGLYRKQA